MKRINLLPLSLCFCSALFTNTCTAADNPPSEEITCPLEGYQLVWSDEFNTSALDNTKWTYQVANAGWVNHELQTYVKEQSPQGNKAGNNDTWPFNKAFYPILNLAWGGDWGGEKSVDETALPLTMEIDYVRIWQKKKE